MSSSVGVLVADVAYLPLAVRVGVAAIAVVAAGAEIACCSRSTGRCGRLVPVALVLWMPFVLLPLSGMCCVAPVQLFARLALSFVV